MKRTRVDKWFFYSMPPYLVISIADLYFKWFDVQLVTFAWIIWLAIGAVYFRLLYK